MFTGRAHGGPRDNVKLMAGSGWSGRVAKRMKGETVLEYHKGYYKWDFDFQAWIWHADKPEKSKNPQAV